MKKSYIERAMRMAETLSSYMESYNETMSIYNKCSMAVKEYNIRHKHSSMSLESGSTRLAFIISDYVLKVDYQTIRSFGNSETELEAWDFICENGMEEYFAEITKYVSKSGITFYIMPRIKHIGEYDEEWFYDTLYDIDIGAYCFIQDNFCDFHENNFGIKNGHPVIIDYAWNYSVRMEDEEND